MTEEELKWEAEGYFETSCPYSYADTEDDLKHDVTEAYIAGAEPREKRIKELQQENAELKGQVEMSYEVYNNNLDYSHHIEEQLTNAKEIISEYVRLANLEKEDTVAVWQLYHKAEQFLNSEVEK